MALVLNDLRQRINELSVSGIYIYTVYAVCKYTCYYNYMLYINIYILIYILNYRRINSKKVTYFSVL